MRLILILVGLLLCVSASLYGQRKLIKELRKDLPAETNDKHAKLFQDFKKRPFIKDVSLIELDLDLITSEEVEISIEDMSTVARKKFVEDHGSGSGGSSWFGQLADETGIFFTVIDGKVASKFYLDKTPCLIIPFDAKYHLLVRYSNDIDSYTCGTPHGSAVSEERRPKDRETNERDLSTSALSIDDACTMRVLFVVTTPAEAEIPMSLELAARMLQDETNLAYEQSQINLRMEIARVVRTSYVETTTNTSATAYGSTSSFPTDLVNLRNGSGLLSTVATLRNTYSADVVAMVRSAATNSTQGFFGIAFGIPTGTQTVDPLNAFCLISTEHMIGGRFTFAHEIGHIQGARHDNHTSTPAYARGFVFSTASTTNRTIMAVGCSSSASTGCRVQFFSNPDVTFNGIAVGVADQRDNARRINETSTQLLANRLTTANLLLSNETFENEILARHLATNTISTNNSTIEVLSGSRVSMRAGSSISLLPGFRADAGSSFAAYINTCSFVPTGSNAVTVYSPQVFDGLEANERVQVYPNPGDNSISVIHGKEVRSISMVNALGTISRTVLTKPESTKTEINIQEMIPGLYIIEVGKAKIKFIKR
jgi:hypothetical protein